MGDAVTLKCRIMGTPDISVAWFQGDGKLRKSNICSMDFSNGVATLKLAKTTKFDLGEYTCQAENRIGSASTSCKVVVKGDARFPYLLLGHSSCCGNETERGSLLVDSDSFSILSHIITLPLQPFTPKSFSAVLFF